MTDSDYNYTLEHAISWLRQGADAIAYLHGVKPLPKSWVKAAKRTVADAVWLIPTILLPDALAGDAFEATKAPHHGGVID